MNDPPPDDQRHIETAPIGAGQRTSPDGFASGSVVAGRYRIDTYLAGGGMGQVYRAHDLALDVPLALKTIRPEIASDPASLHRFKREVLLARSVSHPNVCRIFDIGHDEPSGVSFLTMEFLPGGTLASRIATDGALPTEVSLPLVRQMADALDAAHRAGIVHRDFKSPNVMVVPESDGDRVVITDFGLAVTVEKHEDGDPSAPILDARTESSFASNVEASPESDTVIPAADSARTEALDARSVAGREAIVGTPAYMSPEQVRGGAVGPPSDLYALGVVLFEMCTGQLPFRGETPVDTARAHLTREPPSPRSLVAIDETWERTILRLLSKRPEDRHATAHDVVLALEGRTEEERATPYSLPSEPDAFVGRSAELAALASHLGTDFGGSRTRTRLLTLQGPGGTGKTRVVTRYGWESLGLWPGGVWFCDLSETHDANGIAAVVAKSLNVPLGTEDPILQLGHAIAGRGKCLLILDNFEQVAEHAEATVGRWAERATEASFLVTSRERLHLSRETILELDPLDPTTQGVELFEARARAHRPGFSASGSHRERVEEIVKSLDGLPLAIELAAARLRMLNLEQLRARLQDRFRILSGGKRGRHATLRTTLDWSWDLLQPWEQSAIAQASVFEGGFTLEAAEAVIDLSAHDEDPPMIDVIQSLVDKSWLRAKVALGAPRFDMFMTVQEYTSAKLGTQSAAEHAAQVASSGSSGSQGSVEIRHGAYYSRMGTREAMERLELHGGVEKLSALRVELDNLIVACQRAIDRGDEHAAANNYLAAHAVLALQGPFARSAQLGSGVLPLMKDPALRQRVLGCLSDAERLSGRLEEARDHHEAALAIARDMGDRRSEGDELGSLGNVSRQEGKLDEARAHYEAALAIAREVGNRRSEGIVLGNLGALHKDQGRMEEARDHLEAALAIHREVGNRRAEGGVLVNLGVLHKDQGRLDDARDHLEAALAIHREVGNRRSEGIALGNLGIVHMERGRRDEARARYESALTIHREVGNRRSEALVLGNLSTVFMEEGRLEDARTRCEEALAIAREAADRPSAAVCLGRLGKLHAADHRTQDAHRCFEEGLAILRDLGLHFYVGAGLCDIGHLEHELGNVEAARAALAEAEVIAEKLALGSESRLTLAIEELRGRIAGEPS